MDEIEESNVCFHEIWSMYARGAGGDVIEQPGILAAWAGVNWPIVNALFLTTPIQDLDELRSRLTQVAAFTGKRQQFGMLVACDNWLPKQVDIAAAFPEHGWSQVQQLYGMVQENMSAAIPPAALEYRRVDGPELRCAAADINAASYGVSPEMGREALDHEELWGEGCFGYVGYYNGNAVATSTTYVRDKYLYVALVATLPDYRSRGFARAITGYSMQAANKASGLQRTILHATPMARAIYDSLGFRTVTTFSMFLPTALLAEHAAS